MSPTASFFSEWWKSQVLMIMKFDPYDALMINRGNHILIVFYVYCCSKHKLSTILLRTLQTLLILSCSYFDPEHYQSLFVYFTSLCLLCMIGLPLWDTVNTHTKNNKLYYYINKTNARWAFARNMISSCVKISLLLRLHNKLHLSHQKSIKVKWFGISLVFI